MSENSSLIKYFICGACGGICTVLAGYPMDTIKVRLQTMPIPEKGQAPLYQGPWDCLEKTIKYEGIHGLYKGMTAPLTAVAPIFAISFFTYGLGKKIFKNDDSQSPSNGEMFAAGSFSGIFTTLIMAPSDRIKSLLQIQIKDNAPKQYKGSFDCAKQLYLEGGIKNIYKGTTVTMLRDVPASGMFYMTYEMVKRILVDERGSAKQKSFAIVIAGGLAGVANWIVALPFDVLKSRLQTAPKGMYPNGFKDVFKELILNEGPGALYTGVTPVMIRAFVANAGCFVGFESAIIILDWIVPNI